MRSSTIFLALSLSACCFGGATGSAPRPGPRTERIAEEIQLEFPDVAQHFAAMSYDESFVAGGALAHRGMPRLSDAELIAHAAMRSRILAISDEACAAMVGGGDQHAVVEALDTLSEDELRTFLRLTTRAQSLELAGGPRPLSREAAGAAADQGIATIRAALGDEDRARWDAAITSTDPADACFIERAAMRESARLPNGAAILRGLLESGQVP